MNPGIQIFGIRYLDPSLTTTPRSRSAAVPNERIAKLLSDRALTADGNHVGLEAEEGSTGDPWSPMTS